MILPKDRLLFVRKCHPGSMLDKYFDTLDKTTVQMVKLAEAVGVRSGMRVLDIGCGLGIFGWVCEQLGAEVVNVDSPMGVVFGATYALGLRYVPHNIRRDNPLPEGLGTFDLITTFHVVIGEQGRLWGSEDYRWFIADGMARLLRPGGSWAWRINRGPVVADVLSAMNAVDGAAVEYPLAGDGIMARIFHQKECLQPQDEKLLAG